MRDRRPLALRHAPALGVGLVAGGAALWGIDGVLRKPLLDHAWSVYTIVLYEHLALALMVGWVLVVRRGELARLSPAGWASVLGIAWGGSALATLAFTEGFATGSVTVVILLQKTQPLWAVGAAALLLRERPRPDFLFYLGPALVGVYLLSFGWTAPADAFEGAQGRAALLALTAAALWGTALVLGRLALREVSVAALTSMRFTFALPLLALIAWQKDVLTVPGGTPGGDWIRIPLIALLPGLVAILLYYRGLRLTPAPVATLAELAFPATALVVNYLFLDETVTAVQLVGFAVLWVTIALLHRLPVRMPDREPEPAPAV